MSICHSSRFSCLAKEMPGGRWPCICVHIQSVGDTVMAGLQCGMYGMARNRLDKDCAYMNRRIVC